MIESTTSKGYVRRWEINLTGDPRCPQDAIPPQDPEAALWMGRNARLAALLDSVVTYRVDPQAEPQEEVLMLARLQDCAAGEVIMDYDAQAEHAALVAYIEEAEPIEPITPVPDLVSDRQFFEAAARMGLITPAEAFAAVKTGDIPQIIENIVAALPEQAQFGARMQLSGAVEFRRDHMLVGAVQGALQWTGDQVDDFFRFAAAL